MTLQEELVLIGRELDECSANHSCVSCGNGSCPNSPDRQDLEDEWRNVRS